MTARVAFLRAYDPSEARVPAGSSEGGQWTAGGDGAGGGREERIARVRERVTRAFDEVARKNGYVGDIRVEDAEDRQVIGGVDYAIAARADLQSRIITVNARAAEGMSEVNLIGLISHEIAHEKYQRVVEEVERATNVEDHPEAYDATGFVKQEYLTDPAFRIRNLMDRDFNVLVEEDGVSLYSRQWWDDWRAGKAKTWQAMHETIAEIARYEATPFLNMPQDLRAPRITWRRYVRSVDSVWNRIKP